LLPGFAQVIGKGGSIIKTIRQESGARVEAEETEPNSRFQGSGVPTFCFCSGFWVWQTTHYSQRSRPNSLTVTAVGNNLMDHFAH
jgi:hypothetical protein